MNRPYKEDEEMDPTAIFASLLLIGRIAQEGPQIINDVSAARQKVDPTAKDFEALITVMEASRPKDPLKKQ